MVGRTTRAASKFAEIFSSTRGFRGFAAERFPVSSASRKAAEDVKPVEPNPFSGVDDWIFAGGEEEEELVEPMMPRVVFGGVPTLEEAKEATSELTVALQETFLSSSPSSIGYEGSVEAHNVPSSVEAHNVPSSSRLDEQIVESTNACGDIGNAVPAPALMAFKFLNESSVAQNVVASIASDPNVWDAVSQNSELQDFLQSQRASSFGDYNLNNMKSVDDSDCSSVKSGDGDSSEPDSGFIDTLQEIKGTVVDMMSHLSDYFQSFFGDKGVNGVFLNSDGTARLNGEALMGRSFMGLAVMAMLVILLKRD